MRSRNWHLQFVICRSSHFIRGTFFLKAKTRSYFTTKVVSYFTLGERAEAKPLSKSNMNKVHQTELRGLDRLNVQSILDYLTPKRSHEPFLQDLCLLLQNLLPIPREFRNRTRYFLTAIKRHHVFSATQINYKSNFNNRGT